MSCYINSTNERLYGAIESQYGVAATLADTDRLSFRSLTLEERAVRATRRDKTGSRTRFAPHPELRTRNEFTLDCYFSGRDSSSPVDAMTTLVEAALGGDRVNASGLTVSAVLSSPARLTFNAAHGLIAGQALRFAGELRFVKSIVDAATVEISAPFGAGIQAGSSIGTSVTLYPGDKPKPLTLGDYWTPAGHLDRILAGSILDEMTISLDSDFHGASFRGVTREVASAAAFSAGSTGLAQFPAEPSTAYKSFQLVPGHVGKLFLGDVAYHLLDLTLSLRNQVDARALEFGTSIAPCYSADLREVEIAFRLFASSDAAVVNLHALSRNRQETSLTIQLGNQAGQLVGVYVPRFVPEIPEVVDSESRAVLSFPSSLAYGVFNDEITVAFA